MMTEIDNYPNKEENLNTSELLEQVQMLSQKLEEIKALAGKEQQRWVGMDLKGSPQWTVPFKKIIRIIEN